MENFFLPIYARECKVMKHPYLLMWHPYFIYVTSTYTNVEEHIYGNHVTYITIYAYDLYMSWHMYIYVPRNHI